MSFMFLTTRRVHSQEVIDKANKIAEDNDATLVWVGRGGIPGNVLTGWFESDNMGSPFDQDRSDRVSNQLMEAGIEWDEDRKLA